VTDVVADLIRDRWIVEGEPQRSRTGRSPVPLHICRKSKMAIAAGYAHGLHLELINAAGEVLRECALEKAPTDPRGMARTIGLEARKLTAGFTGNIIGIGIADPGMIDTTRGEVLKSTTFPGWRNVPMARLVHEATGLPVLLEDSSRLAAMAQYRALPELAASGTNMLGLDFDLNLGFALITPDGAFRGSGFAGDLAHVTLDPLGPRCQCGRQGCVEALAGGRPLVAEVSRLLKTGRTSVLRKEGAITPERVLEAAAGGDRVAEESLSSILPHLGLALGLTIAAYHPRIIVAGAGTAGAAAYLSSRLKTAVSRLLLPEIGRTVEIRAGGATGALILKGAGLMVFNDVVMNNGARLFRA
jgi:glucokinase